MEVTVARSFWGRLRGLALRKRPAAALLIPRCRSVHTFGMRFALHLVWLDQHGRVLGFDLRVPPNRIRTRRDAAAVLEVPAVEGSEMILAMAERQRNRFADALNPRVPIYRDTYNEYFVFVLSAGGAIAGTQVPLYIVMAITGLWDVVPFVLACVVFELAVIFGVARPQMAPRERVAWAALWAAATAALAFAFWHLVASPTL